MKIAVYCGSEFGTEPAYTEAAEELGKWMGVHGHSLIYGGGESGLMGVVAKEVFSAGGHVTGVVPNEVDFIQGRPQRYLSRLIRNETMSERKATMLSLADAFIALPGGIGTLDEITEVITLTKIGVFDKPCILFNRKDFYGPFQDMIDAMAKAGFLTHESMKHVLFSDDMDKIESFLNMWNQKCN